MGRMAFPPSASGMHGDKSEDRMEELGLRKIARLIKVGKAKNIVVLTGAGISTSAGIPDFRSPDTGLYANLEKLDLPTPEAVFDIDYFRRRPEPFWTLAKDLYPGKYLPTPTHHFLSLLASHSLLLRLFSQNIDTLESIAGVPSDRIVEAHGSFGSARCIDCGREYGREYVLGQGVRRGEVVRCLGESAHKVGKRGDAARDEADEDRGQAASSSAVNAKRIAGEHTTGIQGQKGKTSRPSGSGTQVNGCGGLVKPDIVFFGEGLPDRFFERIPDLEKADLVIIIGTSLQVAPFCRLPSRAPHDCPRILINREAVGEFTMTARRQERYFAVQRRKEEQKAKQAEKVLKKAAEAGIKPAEEETKNASDLRGMEAAMANMGLEQDGSESASVGNNTTEQGKSAEFGDGRAVKAEQSASDVSQKTSTPVLQPRFFDANSSAAPHPTSNTSLDTTGQEVHGTEQIRKPSSSNNPAHPVGTADGVNGHHIETESDYSDEEYDERDAFYKGDADTAMWRLAEMLGWKGKLEERVERVNAALQREWAGASM